MRSRSRSVRPPKGDRTSTWCFDYQDCEETYGVYVGMSKYSPAQRFDQHKAGIRAAGSVLKRGIEVLTGPTLHLQYIKRSEASRIEEELALALAAAGLLVKGGH